MTHGRKSCPHRKLCVGTGYRGSVAVPQLLHNHYYRKSPWIKVPAKCQKCKCTPVNEHKGELLFFWINVFLCSHQYMLYIPVFILYFYFVHAKTLINLSLKSAEVQMFCFLPFLPCLTCLLVYLITSQSLRP